MAEGLSPDPKSVEQNSSDVEVEGEGLEEAFHAPEVADAVKSMGFPAESAEKLQTFIEDSPNSRITGVTFTEKAGERFGNCIMLRERPLWIIRSRA